MGGSVEYHLAKADYQCRRALAKLSREENQGDLTMVHRLGHAIATLREIRSALPRRRRISPPRNEATYVKTKPESLLDGLRD